MTTSRDAILEYAADYLNVGAFEDYSPQGLQVQGKADVARIATGVTASVELFERAVDAGADMVLVHHGLFFKNDSPVVKGGLKRRLELLLENDVTLACYHLPLDAHPELGNNVLGLRALGAIDLVPWGVAGGQVIGYRGVLPQAMKPKEFFRKVGKVFGREPLVHAFGPEKIRTVALVTGGGEGFVRDAVEDGTLDCFVTGEVSEWVMSLVKEEGLHFVSAGHYATEVAGIKALGEHLEKRFGVPHAFIDVPNVV